MNQRNVDAMTSTIMESLDRAWEPGLPTVVPALSVNAAEIARLLAEDGTLMARALTVEQLDGLVHRCRMGEFGSEGLRHALELLARGED